MATKLQNLASFWQNFGLGNVQKGLDEVATEITTRQDESDTSRKALIELLRDFKKNSNDEVKQNVAPVVKTFQNEVDSLSKRAKAAEKAFFDIYQTLSEVPDPLPILEQSIERNQNLSSKIQDYEIETKDLRETMAAQAQEIADLKVKEKKMAELQSLVAQYDKNIDETMKQKLGVEVDKIRDEYEEKFKIVQDQKEELEKKCREAENVTKISQRQLEQSQTELYETSNKLAQKSDAKSEEVEMLLTDLENANQRAILAEKEVENLKEQVKFNSENVQGSNFDSGSNETDQLISDLKHELASKDREIDQISTELKQSKEVSQHNLSQNLETIKALEQTNEELSKNLQIQAEKLSNMDDYEIIKKDLSILKTLEFNKDEQDEEQNEEQIPLEVMILERSKTLQIENSALRMDKDKLTTELTSTKESLAEKLNETDKQSILISELEDHVEKLQEHVNRGEAEGRSSTDILLHDLEIKSGRDSPLSVNSSFYGNQNDANSLLPIIQAQRERYKKRNEELEDQQSKQMQQMAILQTEIKDLQADNVKLYEKIRFLQGYQVNIYNTIKKNFQFTLYTVQTFSN